MALALELPIAVQESRTVNLVTWRLGRFTEPMELATRGAGAGVANSRSGISDGEFGHLAPWSFYRTCGLASAAKPSQRDWHLRRSLRGKVGELAGFLFFLDSNRGVASPLFRI